MEVSNIKFSCPTVEEINENLKKYSIAPVWYRYIKDGIVFRMVDAPDSIISFDSTSVIYEPDNSAVKAIICNYTGRRWSIEDVDLNIGLEESSIDPKLITFNENLLEADKKRNNEFGNGYLWKKNIEFTIIRK